MTAAGAGGSAVAPGGAWLVAALAAWLGATALFAAVVAPALFALLPSRALAGLVVGRTLPALFVAGIVVGVMSAGVALAGHPAGRIRAVCLAGGACMALACAAAQLVVGARIRRVRVAIGPSLEALAPGDPLRAEFGRLHGLSVGFLAVAALAAAVVLIAYGVSVSRAAAPHP